MVTEVKVTIKLIITLPKNIFFISGGVRMYLVEVDGGTNYYMRLIQRTNADEQRPGSGVDERVKQAISHGSS